MNSLEPIGLALGLASLSGINLYLTMLLTSVAVHFNLLDVSHTHPELVAIGHPWVMAVAGVLYLVEFVADKIPWVDSAWDAVHTFIRPVGGTLLALQPLGDMPVHVQIVAALLAGGAAFTTHSAKAGTRLLANHSPEPVSNVTLSVTEDAVVAGGSLLALLHPVIALAVFGVLIAVIWLVLPRLWRVLRRSYRLLRGRFSPAPAVPVLAAQSAGGIRKNLG